MEPDKSGVLKSSLTHVSSAAAVVTVTSGILVICGWVFDVPALTSFFPGLPPMPVNAALAFILSGVALWLLTMRHAGLFGLGQAGAAVVALIGLLTLSEYVFGVDLGIDQLFVRDQTGSSPFPGRIPLIGAVNFVLFGIALAAIDVRIARDLWLAQGLALAVAATSLVVMLGYAYDVTALYRPSLSPAVPLHGMVLFVVLAAGALYARPDRGLTALLTGEGGAALLTRRLLPAGILIPPAIGWLRLQGEYAGLYQTNMGVAIFAAANVVTFTLVIWMTAGSVRRATEERRRAEAAIRESQELLHAVTDNTEAVIYVKDLAGRYLMVNRRFSELFHFSSEELVGKCDHDIFPKELADAFRGMDQRVVGADRALTEEEMAVLEDGPHTYVSVKCPLRDGQGRVYGVFGISTDITDRKRAEQALRDSEDRTRSIIDTALEAVVTMNAAGAITGWNSRAEATFGWTRDEAIGRMMGETIIPERFRDAHTRGLQRYLATGEASVLRKRLELSALHRTGREFPVEISITPIGSGENCSFSAFVRDISGRKLAEARIQAQLERLNLLDQITRAIGERHDLQSIYQVVIRSLEERLPADFSCICTYDAANSTLTVAHLGSRGLNLSVGKTLRDNPNIEIDTNGLSRSINGQLVYEPDVRTVASPFPQLLAQGGLCSLVIAPLQSESHVFGILLVARREADGFSSAECEFLRQLSAHVALATHHAQLYGALQRAYEDLRQSQHVVVQQERMRALGQMASGIAHDINNALSPVALYVETLLERETQLSAQGREQLSVMQRAVDDVGNTISRMREFYSLHQSQLQLAPVDINGCVRQVVDLTRARWRDLPQQRGIVIDLRVELDPEHPKIIGAENEIRDAFTNLVFNAVDAMPEGGRLTLRTATLPDRRTDDATRYVVFEANDTGVGMDEETRRRCLEPFFTTKGDRGTGLGLAMVYGAVKRHGAELEIESTPGKGTTVRLIFPPAAQDALSAAKPAQPPGPIRRLRILIVDDDPLLIQSLHDTLSGDGHAVTIADGGQHGINTFQEAHARGESFALVITDLGMPYVDGHKVASAIRGVSPSTPIILLTGWGQRLMSSTGVPPNVDRVLSKPPRLRDLRIALSELTAPRSRA